jgi:hypothetical protein
MSRFMSAPSDRQFRTPIHRRLQPFNFARHRKPVQRRTLTKRQELKAYLADLIALKAVLLASGSSFTVLGFDALSVRAGILIR